MTWRLFSTSFHRKKQQLWIYIRGRLYTNKLVDLVIPRAEVFLVINIISYQIKHGQNHELCWFKWYELFATPKKRSGENLNEMMKKDAKTWLMTWKELPKVRSLIQLATKEERSERLRTIVVMI